MTKKIAIGADHAGFEYKQILKKWLESKNYIVQDFGTYNTSSVDYPDFAHPVAIAVSEKSVDMGILICGSANGVAMTANKHQHIKAAICWNVELATLARSHNDANIFCVPARYVSKELAIEMLNAFLTTPFEGGRHEKRVYKINC